MPRKRRFTLPGIPQHIARNWGRNTVSPNNLVKSVFRPRCRGETLEPINPNTGRAASVIFIGKLTN